MVENTPFNDEWNKLQKTFWDNVGSSFKDFPNTASDSQGAKQPQQSSLFNQWLNDVDKCWKNHAQVSSGDIDSLYNKVSTSSRFFFNFTESMTSNKQGVTADVLIAKYLKEFTDKATNTATESVTSRSSKNKTDENKSTGHQKDKHSDISEINAFWKLPLANWQQQSAFFTSQNPLLNSLSDFLGDAVNNPEFSAALEAYLIALQEYQRIFFNLFTAAAKQTVEALRANNDEPASAKQIMTLWLELLESHYLKLIAAENYSQVYAKLVNSWMLVIDKSNKSFAEFMQANMASAQEDPNGL